MSNDIKRFPRVRGHSSYAALSSFSIACFSLTLITDVAYLATTEFTWETMSVWLLTIGLVAAALAIVAGIVDFVRSRTISGLRQPWVMVAGHIVAFALSVVNVLVHCRDGYTAVVPQGLILSIVTVLVLLASAIMGRLMDDRNRIGGVA